MSVITCDLCGTIQGVFTYCVPDDTGSCVVYGSSVVSPEIYKEGN